MGIECERDCRAMVACGGLDQPVDDPGMAEMDAVEVADADGPATQIPRKVIQVVNQSHLHFIPKELESLCMRNLSRLSQVLPDGLNRSEVELR
jgi:hypothetical protein